MYVNKETKTTSQMKLYRKIKDSCHQLFGHEYLEEDMLIMNTREEIDQRPKTKNAAPRTS